MEYTYLLPSEDARNEEIGGIEGCVASVEKIIKYRFNNKKLLEEALTHPSCTESASYQRLEFIGDAALALAVSNFAYLQYPTADPGKLSLLRSANISTEKLARVAVRHQLYKYVRHNASALDDKVSEFVIAVQQEGLVEVYGGLIKAPKVLADIVESIAAAVYIDCNFDLNALWRIFRDLLEPIAMLDELEQQPQPVTMLIELCQKNGKEVAIKYSRKDERNIAAVYVDGEFVAAVSSEHKENAKLNVAKIALQKLSFASNANHIPNQISADSEVGAKQRLHELCDKKKWRRPTYKIEREYGLSHEKRYVCSVEMDIMEGKISVEGGEKFRLKEAENSAAFSMLHRLKDNNYL